MRGRETWLCLRGEVRAKLARAANDRALLAAAARDFTAAIERDGSSARALAGRGEARAGLGLFADGLADCERAVALDAGYAERLKPWMDLCRERLRKP